MSNEPRYNDLLERREVIFAEWLKLVEKAKEDFQGSVPFYGTGVIFIKDGTLRMTAFARDTHRALFELRIKPFETEVEVTHP